MYNDMNKEKFEGKADLKISGSGSYQGGIFHNVKVSGVGTINGDLECITMDTSGSSKIHGNVSAEEITTSGSCAINGDLEAAFIKTSGSSTIDGNLSAGTVKTSGTTKIGGDVKADITDISGSVTVGGNIHSENVIISGFMSVGGDCEAERVEASGSFTIGGLLNAGTVKIKVGGKCKVREIGGEKIEVGRWKHWGSIGLQSIMKTIFNYDFKLNCDSIEGDEIYLENTSAKVVRGNNVTIGKECEIDVVEYTGTLNVVDGAMVREHRKM